MLGMVHVSEVSVDEWQGLRDVRLAALKEAPAAFGSSYEREVGFDEERWRSRIRSQGVTYFARIGNRPEPVGLAGVHEVDCAADLEAMWVHPSVRGLHVGDALVTACVDWARTRGHSALHLWVTESSEPARRLYERCGFTPTGERQPLPSNPALPVIRMSRFL